MKKGDSLNKVALMHGIPIKDLAFVNKVLNDTIFPDQVLKVPAMNKEPPEPESSGLLIKPNQKKNQISSY